VESPSQALIELLGVVAYGELAGFFRIAADAELAPSLAESIKMAELADIEFRHYTLIGAHIQSLGIEPESVMAPFVAAFDGYHERTKPADWFEGLVKAYVGDSIATDFNLEIAALLPADSREVILKTADSSSHVEFAVSTLMSAMASDPRLRGRLALWARRLVGEAIAQAQYLAAEHEGLFELINGTANSSPVGEESNEVIGLDLGRAFIRLTEKHTHRMQRLGLAV
jgi:hypothetical protein